MATSKLIILLMSCNQEYFNNEVSLIKKTWGSRLPEGVILAYYDGGHTTEEIIDEDGVLHIKTTTDDSLKSTFKKTCDAFSLLLRKGIQFDWVLRTNTSTWVNAPLFKKLVDNKHLANDIVYGTDLYSLTEGFAPRPLDLYARGNCIILSNYLVRLLLVESIPLQYIDIVDDVAIGNALNSYFIKHTRDFNGYLAHIKGLPHGWYKCVSVLQENGHRWCRYGEEGDQAFYNEFLTVQTKMYRRREEEHQNMIDFDALMKDAPESSIKKSLDNMENPPVFLGSVVGYAPYNTWVNLDKNKLYAFEMQNKAIDDKQNPFYSKEAVDKLHAVPGMKI